MANTILTADVIVKESLAVFKNNTPFLQGINRQYDKSYAVAGAREGDTIRIKRPQQYTTRTGKVADVQDYKEQSVSLPTSSQIGVDLRFSSAELEQDIGSFSRQHIIPAMNTLTSTIEYNCLTSAYQQVGNYVGTPGTDPATMLVYGQAKSKLTKFGCPQSDRTVVISPDAMAATVNGLNAKFEARDQLRKQYVTGHMGYMAGFEFAESVNINRHTVGTGDGNYVMTSAPAEGATSLVVKTGTGTFTKGDIITVAGVYAVNPLSKQSTGDLMQFTVTTAYAGGAGTVAVSPAMYSTGPLQNVDALPATDAVITELGTNSTAYDQNIAYHRDAFTFATADLPLYGNTDFEAREVMDGVSIRIEKVVDGVNDDFLYRIDILYGFITVIPEWACRIWGA